MSEGTPSRRRDTTRQRMRSGRGTVSSRLEQALNVAGATAELRRRDHLRLLESIVSTAARVIDATAGSLMLVEPDGEELEFQVAVGPGADEIKHFRVPIGQGIAGFVASTGQALAIADTSQDPRFARQIAEGSGYVPKNLLCVPLLLHGDVIGVMELLDKRGGAIPFTPGDTAVLSSFGEQAALTIDMSLQAQSLQRLLAAAAGADGDAKLAADAARTVAGTVGSAGFDRTLTLARHVAAISSSGERGARLAEEVLQAVRNYLVADPSAGFGELSGLLPGAYR